MSPAKITTQLFPRMNSGPRTRSRRLLPRQSRSGNQIRALGCRAFLVIAGGGAVSFCHTVVLAFGGFFHLPRKLLNALPHDFARLEFDRGARGNDETASGLIGIPSDTRLGQTRLKDSEVAQFDGHVPRQTVRDLVQSPLDHIEDLM